jgi:hypothetical protein
MGQGHSEIICPPEVRWNSSRLFYVLGPAGQIIHKFHRCQVYRYGLAVWKLPSNIDDPYRR